MIRLSLSLLGTAQFLLDGRPASGFVYNKARALLVYLAIEAGRPHQRDELAALLWPELHDNAARTNLRQALANLRDVIGNEHVAPSFLHISRDTIEFNLASHVELDVARFAALMTACERHPHRHLARCRSCTARLEQALDLYRGDFLAGFMISDSAPFEEWLLRQRERLHQQAFAALVRLAEYHERRGDDEQTRRFIRRQLELDPWREEAHRQMMRLLVQAGQRSAALAQYETCRHTLERDLGIEPEAGTTALYEHIRNGARPTEPVAGHTAMTRMQLTQNFPTQSTTLVGRETELAELGALLEDPAHRLITLIGPGGIGKTRLALAAATEHAAIWMHGAVFVHLTPISSSHFVAPAILAALGVTPQGQRDPRDQVLDYLQTRELLLVLDNFEQLLASDLSEHESGIALIIDILQSAPHVTLLVTSRERLALQGEWLFEVSGLSFPIDERDENLETYSAVQLFVQRAGQVRRPFVLDDQAHSVARLCRLVEGLPLAIELAAAALRTRSCETIVMEVETSISTLSTAMRGLPQRHRSIWAMFEHSWHLLSKEEQQVLPQLSIFRGGFEKDAAAEITQASSQTLAGLVDKSLLRWNGVNRYNLHELVRQYANDKLEEGADVESARKRYAAYYLHLAERAEAELTGPQQKTWLTQLETEHDNLRAALEWSLKQEPAYVPARLAGALALFWDRRGLWGEGKLWLERTWAVAKASTVSLPPAVQAKLLLRLAETDPTPPDGLLLKEQSLALYREAQDKRGSAQVLWALGRDKVYDIEQRVALLQESMMLYRELDDKEGIAFALLGLGLVAQEQNNYERATQLFEESLILQQEIGHMEGRAWAISSLGQAAQFQGNHVRAAALFEQSLAIFRELCDTHGIAESLRRLGDLSFEQQHYGQAMSYHEASLVLRRELGIASGIAWTLLDVGQAARLHGSGRHAAKCFAESLTFFQGLELPAGTAWCLEGVACVLAAENQAERAACLFGSAEALRERTRTQLPTSMSDYYTRDVAAVHARLNDVTFAAAWAAGRALTREQVLAYAFEGVEAITGADKDRSLPQKVD